MEPARLLWTWLPTNGCVAYGVDIVRMRPFNHTGAGQRAGFVCADFARQLVAI